jgi:hypothetical protein
MFRWIHFSPREIDTIMEGLYELCSIDNPNEEAQQLKRDAIQLLSEIEKYNNG